MTAFTGQDHHALAEAGRPAPPGTVVIFGAAGDLTKRKLLPALYNLKVAGLLPHEFAIVGVARRDQTHEQFRREQTQSIREFATTRVDEALWAELREAMYFQAGELTDPAVYTQLANLLAEIRLHSDRCDLVYEYRAHLTGLQPEYGTCRATP